MEKRNLYKKEFKKFDNIQFRDFNTIDNLLISPEDFDFKFKFKSLRANHDEDFFIENYGNPLCTVRKSYFSFIVEQNGPKVSMKYFVGLRERKVGEVFFRVKKSMRFVTVNLDNGDVYSGDLLNFNKKRKCSKSLRKNYFLNDPINNLRSFVKNNLASFEVDGNKIFEEGLLVFMRNIDPNNLSSYLSPTKRLIKFYLDKKNIKYPNNFSIYFNKWISDGFRKNLRKNQNKVVDTVMKEFGFQGTIIRKALHNCKNHHLESLKSATEFFQDLIHSDYDLILDILNMTEIYSNFPKRELFSKAELKRIYKLFKESIQEETISSYTFTDHFRMYEQLKNYGESIKWMSDNDRVKFQDEHLEWTNKLEYFKRGIYKRVYSSKIKNSLKPFKIKDVEYFPILLEETPDYSEETNHQSNCVKTYIGRPSSIIISLRKDNELGEDRATLEYYVKKQYDKVTFRRVQSLGKYNSKLNDEWNLPLEKLDDIISKWVSIPENELLKIFKECANGVKFTSDSYFDENGNLRWTYNKNEDRNLFDYNIFDL